ncbi:MAG TPA: DUF2007 domain-containing protein [Verrucomicrobiae bacterium]|jgi:hypothetical protein
MKTCPYCGAEYPDDTTICAADHTPLDRPAQASAPEQQPGLDFVTLTRCQNLFEADFLASRLQSAGIEVFIPDASVMQVMGAFDQSAFGYVRVQVSPKDYDAAKELLSVE